MFRIATVTEAAAKADGIVSVEKLASLDRLYRNMAARLPFVHAGRDGTAFLYDAAGLCALRLAHKASVFGLDRWMLEVFVRWMQTGQNALGMSEATGPNTVRILSPCEEAIVRVRRGETFSFHVILQSDGQLRHEADWQKPNARTDDIFASAGIDYPPEDARFTLPASRLIGDLLAVAGVA